MSKKPENKYKKLIINLFKIAISAGLLYYVFAKKLDFADIIAHYKNANFFYIGLAVMFFILSQIVSILRLDIYLRNTGIHLSFKSNTQLYLLGMFYNSFIPGGIGGDAYKVYILNKKYKKTIKSLTQAVFLDRFIGLAAIFVIICEFFFFVKIPIPEFWQWLVLLGGILGFLFGPLLLGWIFPKHKKIYYKTLLYSILVQIFQVIMVLCIMRGLGISSGHDMAYLLMFLVSSILSVISFSGLGIREYIFFNGAHLFYLDTNLAAGVALMFSLITSIISFFGVIYMFKEINLEHKTKKN